MRRGLSAWILMVGLVLSQACGGKSSSTRPTDRDGSAGSSSGEPPINADPATGQVPDGRCPLYSDGVCPEGCFGLHGVAFDLERVCWSDRTLIDCAPENVIFPDAPGCYVNLATGIAYWTTSLYFDLDPRYRECTDEDFGRLVAGSRQPPCE